MRKFFFFLLASAGSSLAGCQNTTPTTSEPLATTISAAPVPTATPLTEADARAAVARHLQTLPNAKLYVPDSARVNDNGPTWQVLVPRRDWAKRMPNSARFEVNKTTGEVTTAAVK